MLRRLLGLLLSLRRSSVERPPSSAGQATTVTSGDMIYSLATLHDPAPAVDPGPPDADYRSLHEDDWRQIEFVAGANLAHIQRELAMLAAFKEQHARGPGWTDTYLRTEHPVPLEEVGLQATDLPTLPLSSLVIPGQSAWSGKVRGGFALSDGEWFLYGQRTPKGLIVQLALSPARSLPTDYLASSISRLAHSFNVLLVDWYKGSLIDVSSHDAVLEWARRFCRVG